MASFFICEILFQMDLVILCRVYIFNLLITDGMINFSWISALLWRIVEC